MKIKVFSLFLLGLAALPAWAIPATRLALSTPGQAQTLVRTGGVNVHTLGIMGRGISDETAALQKALDTRKHLYLPAGIYEVSAPLRLPRGATLRGDGAATILQETDPKAAQILEIKGSGAAYAGDNDIAKIQFVGVVDQPQFAIHASKARRVFVHLCIARNCGLIFTDTQRPYKEITSEDDLNRNITLAYNDIAASAEHPSKADGGIRLSYVADARVSHNSVRYFRNGIEWWGGDAAFGKDGAITNPRWARRIRIANNTVGHSAGGGIWGSMGQNITISRNAVFDSGDVGIDFEGCLDCVADSNTEGSAPNGGLAVFFATKNVTFRRNTVGTSKAEQPLFRSYNPSLDPAYGTGDLTGMGCALEDNDFVCQTGVGIIDDHNGPNQLTFRNNHFENVRLNISHVGSGSNSLAPIIIGNTLTFNEDVSDFFAAINVFSSMGNAVVSRNTIAYKGKTQANKTGIQIQTQPHMSSAIQVEGNTVKGFGLADIFVYCYPDGKNTATVSGNHVAGKTIKIGPARAVTVQANGNTDANNAAIAYQPVAEGDKPQNHIVP